MAIDRRDNRSNIYHVARLHFHERGGLFFLFHGDETWRQRVQEALTTLQDQGFGSERTYGFGLFELEQTEPVRVDSPKDANGVFLLSLCAPKPEELNTVLSANALYTLHRRAGFVDSPYSRSLRRAQVYMLAEGAVLPIEPCGHIVDVRPRDGKFPHEVWRFGRALCWPAKIDWSYHA